MSINAISNLAVARRPDFEPANAVPRSMKEMADAAGATPQPVGQVGGPPPPNGGGGMLQSLTTYIPTEILTLYVSAIAALGSAPLPSQAATHWSVSGWIAFFSFLVITPFSVWAAFATKVKNAGKPLPLSPTNWPMWEMIGATIAYFAWAFALPNTPFADFKDWYSPGLAGFLVLVISWGLGSLAPLVQRPLT